MRKKIEKIIFLLSFIIFTLPINVYASAAHTDKDFMVKFNAFVSEYRPFMNIVMGLLLLISMIVFIFHVVSLSKNADNPQKRAESLHNLLVSGVCLAIQGSVSLFVALYFYIFN